MLHGQCWHGADILSRSPARLHKNALSYWKEFQGKHYWSWINISFSLKVQRNLQFTKKVYISTLSCFRRFKKNLPFMMKVMVWSFVYAILPYDFISSQQRINNNLLKIPAKQLYRKLTPNLSFCVSHCKHPRILLHVPSVRNLTALPKYCKIAYTKHSRRRSNSHHLCIFRNKHWAPNRWGHSLVTDGLSPPVKKWVSMS